MSKVNFITIKNRQNGFTRTLGEPEFNGMIDKADYEIVTSKNGKSSSPDDTWKVIELTDYLRDKGISIGRNPSKADLLIKAKNANG